MKYTKNLRLPIFDNPSEDKFNISNWNEGNENIDEAYGGLKEWSDNLPLVSADAEIIDARCGEKTLGDKVRKVSTQLDDKVNYCNFSDLLMNNKIAKIKLIGDSITWGADGEGYNTGNSGRVIYDGYTEMNHNTKCFANMFRNFIKNKNSKIDFFNCGISGHSMKDAYNNRVKWIGTSNDIVFINLGINDGSATASITDFETYTREVFGYAKENSNYVYVCTTPIKPKKDEFNTSPNNHCLNDRNMVIRKVAHELNLPLLDINKITRNISSNKGIDLVVGDFYYDDLTHPSSKGHEVLWTAYQSALGIDEETTIYENETLTKIKYGEDFPSDFSLNSTPFTHGSVYAKNSVMYICVASNFTVQFKTPDNLTGIVIITNVNRKYSSSNGFLTQQFIADNGNMYTKMYQSSGTWTSWKRHFDYFYENTNLTLESGWSKSSFTTTFVNRQENNINLQITANGEVTTTGNQLITTLETLYRPKKVIVLPLILDNGTVKKCFITTDGKVYINGVPVGANVGIAISGNFTVA